MPQRVLRLINTTGTNAVFGDPDNRNNTFRLVLNVKGKKAGDVPLTNSRMEYKSLRSAKVIKPGCEDLCSTQDEIISITTIISGSIENKDVVAQVLADHMINVNLAKPDGMNGYLNTSAQYIIDSVE